jgi:hypothetical protein
MANGLHNNYSTPSSSWGLHLGSTTTGPAPSLYFGGYDKTRAYGDVLSKPGGVGPVDLLDIKIGVLAGLSPYEFNMTSSGLLHKGSIQQDPVSVGIDPCAPYLSIPRLACDAIAEYLPVTLDRGLGLYIWDVASPQYTKIVNSATALSFVFSSSDFYNVTISVPFKHLNLTLTSPLTETEVSYFPCNPLSEPPYVLGRAFLQDAFISQNYERDNGDGTFGRFYMAQAAGPNISGTPTVLPISKPDLGIVVNGNSDWMATWDGYWTPLSAEQASNHNNGTTSGKPQVLPSGAIAGIAVGVVVIVLLVIGLLTLFILKKQNKTLRFFGITVLRAMPTAEDRSKIDILHEGSMDRFIEGPPNQISEMEHKPPELFAGQVYHELPLTNKP